jgi:hypothetical protein
MKKLVGSLICALIFSSALAQSGPDAGSILELTVIGSKPQEFMFDYSGGEVTEYYDGSHRSIMSIEKLSPNLKVRYAIKPDQLILDGEVLFIIGQNTKQEILLSTLQKATKLCPLHIFINTKNKEILELQSGCK